MNNVDKFYDIVDNACMYLHSKIKINYFDALVRVGNDLLNEIDVSKIDDEDVKVLEKYYNQINQLNLLNEEVRQAMELLIVKAMKHINMSLDLMTPDYICYLFGFLINSFLDNTSYSQTIMDVEVGTGNLINAISNFIEMDVNLIGIDNNEKLIALSNVNSELQNNEISLYYQDVLNPIMDVVDVVIGDLDTNNNEQYLPYAIINHYLQNIKEKGLFIYLIENDFFNNQGIEQFKKDFKGTLLGLIVLPPDLFQNNHIGKSILIGSPRYLKGFEMMVMQMPSLENKELFNKSIQNINQWIKRVKEKVL